nr:hypothetical protein [Tanacetum cinerariifolium]
ETAFPSGDVRYGEAFPTDTSLDAGQYAINTFGIDEFLYQPAKATLTSGEDAPNTRGDRSREDLLVGDTVKDSDKSADKESNSTDEMSHVLGSLGAENILASGGLRSVFSTTSLSVVTTSIDISHVVATASESFSTAAIFTTASVATPTTRVTRSSRGVVIGSSSPISVNIPSISKKDKGKGKITEPKQPSKEENKLRDYEIARIHAERELEVMIAQLDKSNEMIAKYLSKYEQATIGLSHNEKVELINELLMYQRHLAPIKMYQAQQNKPATKIERRNFYMSILRSNAVWEKMQDFMPMNSKIESERLKRPGIQLDKERSKKLKTTEASSTEPTQEQQSKEPKELSKEELKKMIELVPVEELYIKALQSLIKETCSTTDVIDEKAKELWVKLKRLYEPDSRDPLWALQSEDALSAIVTKLGTPLIFDFCTSDMCMQSWGRSSYARAMIELRADLELKDNIVVAMPKLIGENTGVCEKKALKKPSQTSRGVLVGPKMGFKPQKEYRPVPKKPTSSSSDNKKKGVVPTIEVSNYNSFEVLNSLDNDVELGVNGGTTNLELLTSGKVTLVDEAGNPLKKVEYPNDYDSEDDVVSVDNDMARSMALERVGFGTQSLLEQCRDPYGNGDFDENPYDDDMYEGYDLS